jgi:hypothetical protein
MSAVFEKPSLAQVREWYEWIFSLTNKNNPFHPTKGGQFLNVNNTNGSLFWLAGVTATTVPAYKPSQIPKVNAIVQESSEARAVYNDGDGNPAQKLPPLTPRNITIDKGDNRALFMGVSTELATAAKYPELVNNLKELAQEIIDREDVKGSPPAFVQFEDAQGNKQSLNGSQLKTGFRVNGAFDQLNVPPDNVFMLPPGNGPAAFSDYSVILKRDALTQGRNTLRYGVNGKFFAYTVEYIINA